MRKLGVFLATVLMLPACAAKTPEVAITPTPTLNPSISVSPSPTATKKKRPPPRARFAVYALEGAIYLYDVRDDSVRELARGEGLRMPKFVSAKEVSFVQNSGGDSPQSILRIINVETRAVRDVFTLVEGIDVYGWSPDRHTVAYITTDDDSFPHLHYYTLIDEGSTRTVTTLARAPGRELDAIDQSRIEWSRDGENVLVVYTAADGDVGREVAPDESQLQVRSRAGLLLHAAPHAANPSMAFWSPGGARAYYRAGRGARFWSAKTRREHGLPNPPAWFNPWISPDANTVAYDTGSGRTSVRVEVYDVLRGSRRTISGAGWFHPVYASTRAVWMQRVRACEGECLLDTEPVNQVVSVDLRTGGERRLGIRSLLDVDVLYR